jgi:hypothetical protein
VSFDSEFPTAPYDPTDPLDLVYGYVRDLAIAPTGQWALAACTNGVFAVALYGGPFEVLEDLDWRVTDTFYPFDTPLRPDPFGPGRSFTKVEGVCWLGTQHLAMSFSNEEMGQESSGGLAVFSFLHHVGTIGEPVVHFLDQPERPSLAAVDQIPGKDFYLGGSLRSHLLPDGTYRIYATSHYSGAVVEYEFDPTVSGPSSVTHLSTWSDGTHFSETTDCRPYDVGHPDGVPVVLVGRFLQTIAVLAATGFVIEQEP